MQPILWQPPVALSEQEEQIVKKIRKAKLFVFLRQHRHELLDEAFQQELASLYRKAEDTSHVVGHALNKVMRVVADRALAGAGRSCPGSRGRTGV